MDTPVPRGISTGSGHSAPHRPTEALLNTQSTTDVLTAAAGDPSAVGKRRRNHRGGKKKKNRKQSFLPDTDEGSADAMLPNEPKNSAATRPPFYRLGQSGGRNLSDTSLDSNALLDHRDHPPMRQRRESRVTPSGLGRMGQSSHNLATQRPPLHFSRNTSHEGQKPWPYQDHPHDASGGESDAGDLRDTDRTPLLSSSTHFGASPSHRSGYGMIGARGNGGRRDSQNKLKSASASPSSKHRRRLSSREQSHDINNPPSVPNSPKLGPDIGYGDVMASGSFTARSPKDQLIDIDDDGRDRQYRGSSPSTPRNESFDQRRHTIAVSAEGDVCFPVEGMSTIGEDDYMHQEQEGNAQSGQRRRRFRQWPDLTVLEDWSREEKEYRSEGIRAKQISEPVLVNGRLRPQKHGWHRTEEDAPYRFTYFNEELPSTIHSQTISELLQPGQDFKELFIPDPPELSDESSDEDDMMSHQGTANGRDDTSHYTQSRLGTRHSSIIGNTKSQSAENSGDATPSQSGPQTKPKRYGERPTFWLDVLCPTDTEMRVISKAFGIHPLTAEDIMMQEAREKVELFRNYYLVNYRTFDQDTSSEDYLDPVNMYVVVFREGVISFHFSMTPHPANVRRRIRQLKEYLILSSDWISYAIIDDVTDAFAPLIQNIEEEVDNIDDSILQLHNGSKEEPEKNGDGSSESGGPSSPGSDILRRVGEGRKKVMSLMRLLGNKPDVIKGFAKRCNERYEIAPRSDIGLYLGDIQDHILTMTGNLNHCETLLSRAHSNYLAQINIRMNERAEKTADVLGKLTVLGTIVLPMNIITGMWGMNVLVPGQEVDNHYWFWSITAGLFIFGVTCYFIAKRVYGIV